MSSEALKFLEENMGPGKDFLSTNLVPQETRPKINKSDFMKLKSFYTTKESVNRLKKKAREEEKILASFVSNKISIQNIQRHPKENQTPRK